MDLSKYYRQNYNKEKSLITITWKPATERMSGITFKAILMEILEFIKVEHPRFYLANTQDFLFTIIPDMQEWSNKKFIDEAHQISVQKMAIVLSSDIFAQVSIEQGLGDDSSGMESAYFSSVKDAEDWLK